MPRTTPIDNSICVPWKKQENRSSFVQRGKLRAGCCLHRFAIGDSSQGAKHLCNFAVKSPSFSIYVTISASNVWGSGWTGISIFINLSQLITASSRKGSHIIANLTPFNHKLIAEWLRLPFLMHKSCFECSNWQRVVADLVPRLRSSNETTFNQSQSS